MIKSVTVTNYLGESLNIELMDPYKTGFAIVGIDGLGPGKADVNISPMASTDGGKFNSARMSTRNVVLSIVFDGTNIEELRHKTYKYFPLKKPVTLTIETDSRTSKLVGYVEKNEPNIFSSQENTQISILCDDPYLYAAGEDSTQVTVFSGIEPLFEFEFENEDPEEAGLEFGEIYNSTEKTVYYTGDIEVGLTMLIHAIGSASNITIYNTGTREFVKIDSTKLAAITGSGIVNGDDIIIKSKTGSKSAYLLRDGVYTNIINCLSKDSSWFVLNKGDNIFAYAAETGSENLQFTITNEIVHEGV